MKTFIHACTYMLLAFNVAWGAYLMAVTFNISKALFAFAVLATILPCIAAALLFKPLKNE